MPNRRAPAYARRISLLGVAVYAATRALAYVPGVREGAPQEALIQGTGGGVLLPVYAVTWGLLAVLSLWKIKSADIILPLASMIGMMSIWGAIWGVGWVIGTAPTGWQTAFTYWGPALVLWALVFLPWDRPTTLRGWLRFTLHPHHRGDGP